MTEPRTEAGRKALAGDPCGWMREAILAIEAEVVEAALTVERIARALLKTQGYEDNETEEGDLNEPEEWWMTPNEADFSRQVTDLAEMLGWEWVHFRAAVNQRGRWAVPISGPLGKGWPDLVLIRHNLLIVAELKREKEQPTEAQRRVLCLFGACGVPAHVWRPSDWDDIREVLQ